MINILPLVLLFALKSVLSKDLIFSDIFFSRDSIEISGLYYDGNKLLFVADKLSNKSIYEVMETQENQLKYKEKIKLNLLEGFNSYIKSTSYQKNKIHPFASVLDLEGITKCEDDYYIVNEQMRDVLKIDKNKISRLNIDFSKIFKSINIDLKKIEANAGFEGIAIDCKDRRLFIAQERAPRKIIEINLKETNDFKIYDTNEIGIDPKISLDYADLYFENSFLYILERNRYLITKFSPKEKKIIDQYSFKNLGNIKSNQLYNTGNSYGLAEGIAFTKEKIFIGFDNNKDSVYPSISKKYNINKKASSILEFKRPRGF